MARTLRPHGRRGELACEILTDFPERLKRLKSAELRGVRGDGSNDITRRVTIRSCWLSQSRGGQAIFHFEGSDSIDDAAKLVGCEVRIPFSERMPLPDSSYYVSDLVGCEVWERAGGAAQSTNLGSVADVQFPGGTPLLVVGAGAGELLIPLAQDICVSVDLAARRIEVVLPEGLREVNEK